MEHSKSFTYLFKNVQSCTDLNWNEKAILSLIITTIINGKSFKLTDKQIQRALDIDTSRVSAYIGKLKKRNIIQATTVRLLSHSGGKPTPQRTIEVNNIDGWITDANKPVFERLNPIKKLKDKTVDNRKMPKVDSDKTKSVTLKNKDNKLTTIDIDENEYIKVHCDSCLYQEKYITDFISLNPDYEDAKPINLEINFDTHTRMGTGYFYKSINDVDKYILINHIKDFKDNV